MHLELFCQCEYIVFGVGSKILYVPLAYLLGIMCAVGIISLPIFIIILLGLIRIALFEK